MEVWGGFEPTINRVGDRFFDQSRLSGHYDRLNDLELFAGLGLKALRYPLLWEAVQSNPARPPDWSWADRQFRRIAALGMRPIAGLVHHGSGPAHTSLTDDGFASGLAAHARLAAERFPWVADWTPVNEPLTTARFSALYGLWHPHARDETSFWRALLNQIDAVRLSMRAIRTVNPRARLIQTEDLGRTFATRPLAEQAAYDNARRWMTWDLLCGRVGPDHDLWDRLAAFGFADRLRTILDDPCPPDVIGVNHYLTSDRFLDHRLERYPAGCRGGNGHLAYADVEAVRVLAPGPPMIGGALREAWDRYHLPVAVTEVHNGCTREEQLRWFHDAWSAAGACEAHGVTVEAVTVWALLGSHNWSSLLCAENAGYEPGPFDIRSPAPRLTALGRLVGEVAAGGEASESLALGDGWWRRDIRLQYPSVRAGSRAGAARRRQPAAPRPLLITGATGTLGQAFGRACEVRGLDYELTDRGALDLARPRSIASALDRHRPWAVINAAGFVRVDEAELQANACMAANAEGALTLARACAGRETPIVCFSSDLVFAGAAAEPRVESDQPAPLGVYGRSKAAMERGLAAIPQALTIRASAFFQAHDPHNFAAQAADAIAAGGIFAAADDLVVSPTHVPDLVDVVLDLLIDRERGVWHIANVGEVSWAEFAERIARACGLDPAAVQPVSWTGLGWRAPRPARVVLASERAWLMPSLDDAIARFADQWRARSGRAAAAGASSGDHATSPRSHRPK